jgi:tetratricopeptide (TPR) repeat protein
MSPVGTLSPDRQSVDAPLESLLSRPSGSLLPVPGQHLSQAVGDVEIRVLRPQVKAFKGHQVDDPAQARERQALLSELESAVDQAKDLVELHQESKIAWARLAQTLAAVGRYEDAVRAAREVLQRTNFGIEEFQSTNAVSELVAGRVLVAAGFSDEAESFFAQHSQLPDAWALLYAAIAENREDHEQALARIEGHDGSEFAGFRGYLLLRVGKWREAITELRKAGGEGSKNPDVLTNLGYAYAVVGSHRKALRCARQAVILMPCSHHLSFNLVSLLVGRALWDDAISELKRLQEIFPNDLKIASAFGFVYLNSGQSDKAIREYRRSLTANRLQRHSPDYAQASVSLAMAEWLVGRRSKGEVLDEVRKQIAQTKPTQAFALAVADLAPRRTAIREVAELYVVLRQQDSEDSLLPLAVKIALLRDDYNEAVQLASRWAELAPLNPDAVQQVISIRGHVYGDFAEAVRVGTAALARVP